MQVDYWLFQPWWAPSPCAGDDSAARRGSPLRTALTNTEPSVSLASVPDAFVGTRDLSLVPVIRVSERTVRGPALHESEPVAGGRCAGRLFLRSRIGWRPVRSFLLQGKHADAAALSSVSKIKAATKPNKTKTNKKR